MNQIPDRPICPRCGRRPVERANYRVSGYRTLCVRCRRPGRVQTDKQHDTRYRALKQAAMSGAGCARCGFQAEALCQLDIDHKNGDYSDNHDENLQILCANCHRLKSHRQGDWRGREDRLGES